MAANNKLTLTLSKASQEGIIAVYNKLLQEFKSIYNVRSSLEMIDKEYQRQNNLEPENIKAAMANMFGRKRRMQDITVPIIGPQVEAGVTYLTNVFLSSYPVFGVVASPEMEEMAMQFDAIMEENSVRGAWVREFLLFFRDGLKYNIHMLEGDWEKETVYSLDQTAENQTVPGKRTEDLWEGNCVKRINMYNAFWDTKCVPADLHKHGEYAGYHDYYSYTRLKSLLNSFPKEYRVFSNLKAALESSPNPSYFYLPRVNANVLLEQQTFTGHEFDWEAWATNQKPSNRVKYKSGYEVTKLYLKLIPSLLGIDAPGKNTPQVWKFYIVNHQYLVFAQRLTNLHNYMPMIMGQPLEDGLAYQTQSAAMNALPYQDMASALWNAHINASRRQVVDRALYNPLMINIDDVNNPNATAKIPVRNIGFQRTLSDAYYQIPFDTRGSDNFVRDAQFVTQMAEVQGGINPVQQGQFVKGNKTNDQFNQTMLSSNGRFQTTAIMIEYQVFIPLKEILKSNIVQYQADKSLFSLAKGQEVNVKSSDLRKLIAAMKVSDGMIPAERLVNTDLIVSFLQIAGNSPYFNANYDLAGAITYFFKTRGLNLKSFERPPEQRQAATNQLLAAQGPQQQPPAGGDGTLPA